MKYQKNRIQPLGDKVLVKEIAEKTKKTASGIIIPDSVHEDKGSKHGKVIAVGPGKYMDGALIKPEVKAGDTVLFQWGDKITIEGEDYYIVAESSLMAVIK